MNLLLWRHAEAEVLNPRGDLARVLTPRGREQAAQGARWIRGLAQAHDWHLRVVASPAVRTQQTAHALDAHHATDPALAPDADPAYYLHLADGLEHRHDALVLVGHQPTIGDVIGELLIGSAHPISVRKGGIWWFVLRPQSREDAPVVLRGAWTPD